MGIIRDSKKTQARILDAAAHVFAECGFAGSRLDDVAKRARTTKQLILHHFKSKEGLFQQVLDLKFRAALEIADTPPEDPADLIADRFRRRAGHLDYIRFLTWEAAETAARVVPAHDTRKRRISEFGSMIRLMQLEGRIPREFDHTLLQLGILSLVTYPMAFGQITKLVTGRDPTDPAFQEAWLQFLRQVGERLLAPREEAPRRSGRRTARPVKTAVRSKGGARPRPPRPGSA